MVRTRLQIENHTAAVPPIRRPAIRSFPPNSLTKG
jgi:hypothetical protein